MFKMGAFKAPRKVGFLPFFYQANWEIVGKDLFNFIYNIFRDTEDITKVNHTLITLVPKQNQPKFINQFLPISLCNVNYKVITNVLVSKLKPIYPYLVSPF